MINYNKSDMNDSGKNLIAPDYSSAVVKDFDSEIDSEGLKGSYSLEEIEEEDDIGEEAEFDEGKEEMSFDSYYKNLGNSDAVNSVVSNNNVSMAIDSGTLSSFSQQIGNNNNNNGNNMVSSSIFGNNNNNTVQAPWDYNSSKWRPNGTSTAPINSGSSFGSTPWGNNNYNNGGSSFWGNNNGNNNNNSSPWGNNNGGNNSWGANFNNPANNTPWGNNNNNNGMQIIDRSKKLVICDFLDCIAETIDSNGNPGMTPRNICDLVPVYKAWIKIRAFNPKAITLIIPMMMTDPSNDSQDHGWGLAIKYYCSMLCSFLEIERTNCRTSNQEYLSQSKDELLRNALKINAEYFSKSETIYIGTQSGFFNQSNADKLAADINGVDYVDLRQLIEKFS